ncbi:MAG TPA: ABC transporter ATP-binding protein [Methanosarcinales archaeon]|nr:ABC transporter ATP-binding protein [Methanosarcinales archaeon]
MSFLVLNHLGVSLGDFNLENINLDIDKGEFFVVLGPTGSGKTILLESIAGLHSIKGKIFIDGREVTNHPPEKRNIGFMFQDYALFPHLNVYQNVKFGLKYKKLKIKIADKKVMELLDLVGVSALKHRKIDTLSGGEQQRVALARALVVEPQILLLDEPLSALDVHTKDSLRNEMKNIIERLGITTIYVTHDQSEAELLANRIGLMMNGKIVQVDTPNKIFNSPKNKEVAEFIGMENIIHGTVISSEKDYAIIRVADTNIKAITSYGVGDEVKVCIRPENVFLHNQKYTTSARNQLIGEIVDLIPLGPIVKVILCIQFGFKLSVIVTKRSVEDLDLRIGKKVYASFKATAIHVI